MGITCLITLTEDDLPQDALSHHGLTNLHLPIYDRQPPTVPQITTLLVRMERLMARGELLTAHCLAGIGRTGTVLACWLIREGLTANEALRRVRRIEPRFVQSEEQEVFLHRYENEILRRVTRHRPPPRKHCHPSIQKGAPMSLDTALNKAASTVECLAAGYVDLASDMLLAIKTVDSHPREMIGLVAAATADLFNGITCR